MQVQKTKVQKRKLVIERRVEDGPVQVGAFLRDLYGSDGWEKLKVIVGDPVCGSVTNLGDLMQAAETYLTNKQKVRVFQYV